MSSESSSEKLSEKERRLIRLFCSVVLGDWATLKQLRRAAPEGEPDRAWRETVLQAHLFAGFPRVVEACGVLEGSGGLGTPSPSELRADQPDAASLELGREMFEKIYGSNADAVDGRLSQYHGALRRWIIGHAYGRVLPRAGLSLSQRELLAVAALAVTHQDRQLISHTLGARRAGASGAQLFAVLDELTSFLGPERLKEVRLVLEQYAEKSLER